MLPRSDRRLALFGATGSIGVQTLDVVARLGGFRIALLTAGTKWEELAQAARLWHPERVVVGDAGFYSQLKEALVGTGVEVTAGADALSQAAAEVEYDLCVNGLVGVSGLLPSYHSLQRGIDLALANKESLVLAGDLLNDISRQRGAQIIPVDSEHCAIFQCLRGEDPGSVKRLVLTASGGPFWNQPDQALSRVTPKEALQHPTWKMGAKITIDSATLMNKGLEVIEAHHLFAVSSDRISVVIHPTSIVHSMVEFVDGSVKAQLGFPDMRLPIQYALTYPNRQPLELRSQDPTLWPPLEFYPVNQDRFPCLRVAYEALEAGEGATAVLNGADEAAVDLFLQDQIAFTDIPVLIAAAVRSKPSTSITDLESVLKADERGRSAVRDLARSMNHRSKPGTDTTFQPIN